MQQTIRKYDVNAWAVDFFGELKKVKSLQLKFEVKFLGLIAEHGAKHKHKHSKWSNEALAESITWKNKIEEIMQHYVIRSPNSFIEKKEFSLAWHYRNADPFLANRRA